MGNMFMRKYVVLAAILLVGGVFLVQLFYLQVLNVDYKLRGVSIARKDVVKGAPRGLFYDRNGKLIVHNKSTFDLRIIPRRIKTFDTLELCNILRFSKEELETRFKKAKSQSQDYYKYVNLYKNLDPEMYAVLKEKLYKYEGFYIQATEAREYNFESLAHSVGYVKEVSGEEIKNDSYYQSGDYIGRTGVEKVYETVLRGEKGVEYFLHDNKQKIAGRYQEGAYDQKTLPGRNITLTIDIELQEYAQKLMQNKKGGIVAIEPASGEILAKVSAPAFNLNQLYETKQDFYSSLAKDENKPLFDRTMSAQYPPGSIFKLINALIGLQEGIFTPGYRKSCYGGASWGNFRMPCHGHPSPVDIKGAVKHSCNPFFVQYWMDLLAKPSLGGTREAFQVWENHVRSFGLGEELGTDFPNELKGLIPSLEYYDKKQGRTNWVALNIASIAIGQGELLITPLQMANMITTISNRGYYYPPHIAKKIEGGEVDDKFREKHKTKIDSVHYETVIEAMSQVVKAGTGQNGAVPDIEVCGKTGTVQVPGGEADHSVFVAFAPKEQPKIALVVYVENGIWGSRYAAPIASLIIEKYLKGTISDSQKWKEQRMLDAVLIEELEEEEPEIINVEEADAT